MAPVERERSFVSHDESMSPSSGKMSWADLIMSSSSSGNHSRVASSAERPRGAGVCDHEGHDDELRNVASNCDARRPVRAAGGAAGARGGRTNSPSGCRVDEARNASPPDEVHVLVQPAGSSDTSRNEGEEDWTRSGPKAGMKKGVTCCVTCFLIITGTIVVLAILAAALTSFLFATKSSFMPFCLLSERGSNVCKDDAMQQQQQIFSPPNRGNNIHKDGTLGAALDAMEVRVRNAGITFEFKSPTQRTWFTSPLQDTSGTTGAGISGKVLRSKALIELAIIQAVADDDSGSLDRSVDVKVDAKSALKQGNVIAFRVLEGGFLRMNANRSVERRRRSSLDLSSDQERFLVVMAGVDRVAFYSPTHKRFLRMGGDGTLSASQSIAFHNEDRPRSDEVFALSFLVKENRLHSTFHGKHGRVHRDIANVEVHQIRGLDL
jgi:hypothetical protein